MAKVVHGPAYSGLNRQVVLGQAYGDLNREVVLGPAYSGLYRQVVFKIGFTVCTVERGYQVHGIMHTPG